MRKKITYIEFIVLWAISSTTGTEIEELQRDLAREKMRLDQQDWNEITETLSALFNCPIRFRRPNALVDVPSLVAEISAWTD